MRADWAYQVSRCPNTILVSILRACPILHRVECPNLVRFTQLGLVRLPVPMLTMFQNESIRQALGIAAPQLDRGEWKRIPAGNLGAEKHGLRVRQICRAN